MEVHETKKEEVSKNIVNSFVDFLFSDKEEKWLILILLIGVLLRFLVARNISALGDEMVHGPHAIGFLHSGLISTLAQSPLWFYLTDIVTRFLNVTLFSVRFLSFFYGSLSIIIIYLLTSKMFDKKVALISSFLLSVSFFTIRYTLAEMDLSAIFFLLLAIYFFLESNEKNKFPFLSAVCLGIASLIKTLSLFFVPAFLIAFFLFNQSKEKKQIKNNLKKAFIFGIVILLFFSPILLHNYFWYKDKGMVDTYFAQYFDIGEVRQAYAGQLGYDSGLLSDRFVEGVFTMSNAVFSMDPLIVLIGIFGIILSFSLKNIRKEWFFLILFQSIGFIFLILSNWLATHYTTMIPVFCIFGGFFIDKFSKSFKTFQDIGPKKILAFILILIFLFQICLLFPHLTSRSGISQMRNYAIDNMEKDSIVIVDARIYRGRIVFMFHDFHYLESSFFPQIIDLNQKLPSQNIPTKVYFIECVRDDCGWGTITEGGLNDSSEQLVQAFSEQATLEKTIYGGGGYDEETGKPYFKIYSTMMNFKPQIMPQIDLTHEWFYYPVNYIPKEKIWDNYNVYGVFDNLLYLFSKVVIFISIFLAILLGVWPFYLIYLNIR